MTCPILTPTSQGAAIDAIVSEEGKAAFQQAMLMLVLCAVVCGVCTGLRGGIFTVVGARVNRRLRLMLFQALVKQVSPLGRLVGQKGVKGWSVGRSGGCWCCCSCC